MPKDNKSTKKHQVKHSSTQKNPQANMTTEPQPPAVIIEHLATDELIYSTNVYNWHIGYAIFVSLLMTNIQLTRENQPPYLDDILTHLGVTMTFMGIAFIDIIHRCFVPVTLYDNELPETSDELIVDQGEVKTPEQKRNEANILSLLLFVGLTLSNIYQYIIMDDYVGAQQDRRHSLTSLFFNAVEIIKLATSYSKLPPENLKLALKERAELFRDIFNDFSDENVRIIITIHTGNSIANSQIRIRAMDKENDQLLLFTQRMKLALIKCGFNFDADVNNRIIAVNANFDIKDVDVKQIKTKLSKLYANHAILYTNIKALNKQLKHLAAKFPGIHFTTTTGTQLSDTAFTFVLYVPQDYREVLTMTQWQQLFPEAQIEEIQERIHLKSSVPSAVFAIECQKLSPPELPATMHTKSKTQANTDEPAISEGKQEAPFPAEKRHFEKLHSAKATEKTSTEMVAAPHKRIQWNDQFVYQSDNEQCPIQPIRWPNGKVYPNHYAVFQLKPEDMTGENVDEMHATFEAHAKNSTLATSSKGASGIKLFTIAKERRDPKTRQRYIPAAEIKILGNYGQKANRRVFGELLTGPHDEMLIVWNHYDPDAHKNKLKS